MVATVQPSEIFRIGRRLKTIHGEVHGAKTEFFILDISGQICIMAQKTGEKLAKIVDINSQNFLAYFQLLSIGGIK